MAASNTSSGSGPCGRAVIELGKQGLSVSGDMGWVFGAVTWKIPDPAEQRGNFVPVCSKEDGTWKNVVQIRNSNR